LADLNQTQKQKMVEALQTDYSVRQICDVLGFNRSSLYYQPKSDPFEQVLRDEIEKLSARYPTYGYRRITQLLGRMGYAVGYRRVARLMKEYNLSVTIKRACQTTQSFDCVRQWVNRLENLDICRPNQVWVGDITYVRLKGQFVYVAVLMDVFTRMIRGWQISRHLTQPLTLKPLQQALSQSVPEIHHSDQGVQYLSTTYISTLIRHGIEISLAHRGRPWENGYAERLIRTLKEEEVHLNDYDDIIEAKKRIGHFIVQVYNQKRPHSALGYLTPVEFDQQYLS
jgi:transposase InsO family protein